MPTEAIGTVNNRNVLGMLKGSLENGSITQEEYDELMQLFFSEPKLVQGELFNRGGVVELKGGGDPVVKSTDGSFMASLKAAMAGKPISTSLFMDMGLDKLFDMLQVIPLMKNGGVVGIDKLTKPVGEEYKTAESGMHPLVVFKEMHDAYILDGGTLSFKEFFDAMQDQLGMEGLNEMPPIKKIG